MRADTVWREKKIVENQRRYGRRKEGGKEGRKEGRKWITTWEKVMGGLKIDEICCR